MKIAASFGFLLGLFPVYACQGTAMYSICEIAFETDKPPASVELHAEFRSPKAKTYLVPGFWEGGRKFVLRFSPDEAGEWTYRVTANFGDVSGKIEKFTAVASDAPGHIRRANLHHWQYTESQKAHLWLGDNCEGCERLDGAAFDRYLEGRAALRFTHLRLQLMPPQAEPPPAWWQEMDRRLKAIHAKGMIADIVIAGKADAFLKMFPTWQERERHLRLLAARYAAMNVTWQLADRYEEFPDGRALMKEMGLALRKHDYYLHPRSTGAAGTSAPLLGDGWMNYIVSRIESDEFGSLEHQLSPVPQVSLAVTSVRRLWNTTMNGQYLSVTLASGFDVQVKAWAELMEKVRYWDTEPHFDVDGGRAIAVPDVEYVAFLEKPGKVEFPIEKHDYVVYWMNPLTGETTREKKEFKAEAYAGTPPDAAHEWVLHLSRDGRKEGMAKSYRFESWPNQLQEVEVNPAKIPYEITGLPEKLPAGKPVPYKIQVKRETRGTRQMMFLITGEVVRDGQGVRIVASGREGNLEIPPDLVRQPGASVSLRIYGLNALGKVYAIDLVVPVE